jgi:putative DNA primase/helicase
VTNAATIARTLRGHKHNSGWLVCCPVPAHGNGRGDQNPSLSIRDGDDGKLLAHCFAGCDPLDILDALRNRGLLPRAENGRDFTSRLPRERFEEPPPAPDPTALELWRQGEPIAGTLAQAYLRNRGLRVEHMPTLRFLPRMAHGYMPRVHFDAMLSAVQGPDRSIIAAQLTWLDPSGCGKAPVDPPRRTIGPLRDGAIRLGAAGESLGIAEGVETALAAMQIANVPVWATLGAQRLANVAIPASVKKLHIFADADRPGQDAAEKAARTYHDYVVKIHTPRAPFGDFADIAKQLSGKANAA